MTKLGMNNKYTVQKGIAILLFIFLAFLFCVFTFRNGNMPSRFDTVENFVEFDGQRYRRKNDVKTLLLIGLGESGEDAPVELYTNDQQAEFLTLLSFDDKEKTCSVLRIDVETVSNVNALDIAGNKTDAKLLPIKYAHTYGKGGAVSCRNVADSVSSLLLDNRINHYLSFSMSTLIRLNDFAEGVEVIALDDFTSEGRAYTKGEMVTLNGEAVVDYICQNDGSDSYQHRQEQYMAALFEKIAAKAEKDSKFALKVLQEISGGITSDRTVNQLLTFANKMSEYELLVLENIEGENGLEAESNLFYPDKSSLEKISVELFYEPVNE